MDKWIPTPNFKIDDNRISGLFRLMIATFCVFLPVFVSADDLPELDCVIEPSQIVDIGSASAGVLEAVEFDRGDSVNKNDVIARLESGTERAAAELARVRSTFNTGIDLRRTSAEFFERNQQRSRSLTHESAISKQQLDQLDTEAHVAELQVQQEQDNKQLAKLEYRRAQQALKRRMIKSPINGVVIERFKSVGEYVEDTAIMRVAQLNPLHVETIVPVSYIGQIQAGMQAQITPSVPGQDPEYAVVTRIDRVADAASGTFGVRLELNNPTGDIVTGVRCALQFDQSKPMVAVNSPKKNPPKTETPQVTQPTASTVTPRALAEDQSMQCFEAGPVNQRSMAGTLITQLEAANKSARLREVSGKYPGQYFVLTERTADRNAANTFMAKLKSQNINDMHLLLKGDHARKISLGLYTSQKSAQRRVDELGRIGFDVHVAPRDSNSLWLEVASSEPLDVNELRQLLSPSIPERVRAVPCATQQALIK